MNLFEKIKAFFISHDEEPYTNEPEQLSRAVFYPNPIPQGNSMVFSIDLPYRTKSIQLIMPVYVDGEISEGNNRLRMLAGYSTVLNGQSIPSQLVADKAIYELSIREGKTLKYVSFSMELPAKMEYSGLAYIIIQRDTVMDNAIQEDISIPHIIYKCYS